MHSGDGMHLLPRSFRKKNTCMHENAYYSRAKPLHKPKRMHCMLIRVAQSVEIKIVSDIKYTLTDCLFTHAGEEYNRREIINLLQVLFFQAHWRNIICCRI